MHREVDGFELEEPLKMEDTVKTLYSNRYI